jgi:phage baseplate assembly protein W
MPVYYYDISKKGKDLLGTRDVPMLTNEQAVKESISNLLSTQPGSKLYDPKYGIDLDRYLFEFVDDLTATMMQTDIEMGIRNYEPRATNLVVIVDADEENQTFYITIQFTVNFSNSQQEMKIDFKKIR